MEDGSEKLIETADIFTQNENKIDIALDDYSGIKAIAIKKEYYDTVKRGK